MILFPLLLIKNRLEEKNKNLRNNLKITLFHKM